MRVLTMLGGLLKLRHLRTQLRLLRDFRGFARLHFLHAALELDLLQALREPRAVDSLVAELGIARPAILETLLDLGVQLGDLRKVQDRYQLRSQDVRVLASESGDALAALVQEYAGYHGPVYQHLARVARGDPPGDYLQGKGPLIARSSRVLEPLVGEFVQRTVAARRPRNLLEIGCGSGVYLRHAHAGYPEAQGLAIDLDEQVTLQARENLQRWGLAQRFQVRTADARRLPAAIQGPFDWISLYNNVYYFAPQERARLYQQLRELLSPGGALVVVTLMRGSTLASLNFDLVLQSTVGCEPLPRLKEVQSELLKAGFSHVNEVRLLPSEPFYALIARE